MKRFFLGSKSVPRWVVLVADFFVTSWSFAFSYFVINDFEFSEILRGHFFVYTAFYCIVCLGAFYAMRIHTGLIRYSNSQDMGRIFSAVFISSVGYLIVDFTIISGQYNIRSLSVWKVLIFNFFIASSVLIMLRLGVKSLYFYMKDISQTDKKNILIYGSDQNAILIKQALESCHQTNFSIIGFAESTGRRVNTYIQQKRVFSIHGLAALKKRRNIQQIIMTHDSFISKEKQHIIEACLALGIQVLTVPPPETWIYGELNVKQIQELRIEDLLQRDPIVINNSLISGELTDKKVLITGAAGSIGSEIVRQVMKYDPHTIILCDQAETALHEIQLEIEEFYPSANIKTSITSIQNNGRLQSLFQECTPDIIFHAAAYKHVPLMETHPTDAILNNVLGTKNIADLAVEYGVKKFVMISTDKAVNPTNVMGASKRIAEMYIQSLNNSLELSDLPLVEAEFFSTLSHLQSKPWKTKFITTRFGNVLGSNGSVIPRFKSQIQKGGPITVTHPEITRFFMTIPEAVQLVLEAGTMGKGGEIFIFDMGKPVKIVDLAQKMIQLAGLTPERDIKIVYTGLRPGEKLYEELLNKEEKTMPTHNEKIKIAKVAPCSYVVRNEIQALIDVCELEDNELVVQKMKELVPDFKSNNSQYEKLDVRYVKTSSMVSEHIDN